MMMPKIYGPYKGSKQNKGRPIYVVKTKSKTTSVNKARKDYEDRNGKLPRGTDVDHKDNNHKNDSKRNLGTLSHGKNTAKENKRRAKKKK
jgi:hypothetical protein